MFKIIKEKASNNLINLVPKCEPTIRTKINSIPTFIYRTDCFNGSFLPSTLNDWSNLDLNKRSTDQSQFRYSKVDYCFYSPSSKNHLQYF